VAEVQSRAIDEAIDMMREHPDFRYTLDGSWVAQQFLEGRSEEQRQSFLRLIRDKKIFVPANYTANYTGVPNLENLLRSFYYSYRLLRENGGDFDHAIITDIPSHSWSYPSLLASAGLKYLVLPANNDLGPILLLGHLHEKAPFWWEGPDGGRILLWYSRHYHQVASMFGLPPKVISMEDNLPTFLQIYTRPDYQSDGVIVFGTQWENTDLYREQASLASDWNHLYAYPRLKFTGVSEALGYIAGQMGDSIPVIRGDGGPYWDIFVSGQPYYTALARENEHRILAAERFSTISSLVNPRVHPDRQALEQAWKGLLTFDEQTFSSGRDPGLRARHWGYPWGYGRVNLSKDG
jgi:alpha-mannosidase